MMKNNFDSEDTELNEKNKKEVKKHKPQDENANVARDEATIGAEEVENKIDESWKLKLQIEKENSIALTKMCQQLQADFANYRKRNANLAQESRQNGVFDAVEALLPAFDAIKSAMKHITDEKTLEGLQMIEKEFINNLATLGITPIKSVGEQFDPNKHNAVVAEPVEGKESGEIVEEYKVGFTTEDKVVRVAMVKIAK
ncbi:MAG: nucleotide exchange factor GrpE [Clostridia bacterium]|nr:nucleotide exchange factor GrpE [Clostridia bacterium]